MNSTSNCSFQKNPFLEISNLPTEIQPPATSNFLYQPLAENKRGCPYDFEKTSLSAPVKKTKYDPSVSLPKVQLGEEIKEKYKTNNEGVQFSQTNNSTFAQKPTFGVPQKLNYIQKNLSDKLSLIPKSISLENQHHQKSLSEVPPLKFTASELDRACQSLEEDCDIIWQNIQKLLVKKEAILNKKSSLYGTTSDDIIIDSQIAFVPLDSETLNSILREYDQANQRQKSSLKPSGRVPLMSAEKRINNKMTSNRD